MKSFIIKARMTKPHRSSQESHVILAESSSDPRIYVSTNDLAREFNVSPQTISLWVQKGILPLTTIEGSPRRWHVDVLRRHALFVYRRQLHELRMDNLRSTSYPNLLGELKKVKRHRK